MIDPTRAALALYRILGAAGGHCESDTSGIGACWRNGRDPDARYGADRVCNACLAWDALHPPPTGPENPVAAWQFDLGPGPQPPSPQECCCRPPGSGLYYNPDVILPADRFGQPEWYAQFPSSPTTWPCPHCGTSWNAPVRLANGPDLCWVRASAGLG